MSRGPGVRQADIDRAVAVLQARGLGIARIEVQAGGVVHVIPGAPLTKPDPSEQPADLDSWREKRRGGRASEGA
jgi:hypothetical protein